MSDKLFPARLTPFAKSLERTMGEGVDFDGCRTVIRQTPEGEAMLRTRGGMPEYSLIKKVRRVMPSCVRAPLTEQDYAERTYYGVHELLSCCGMFKLRVKFLKSIRFLDADGNVVVFVFSSPAGNAVMPSGADNAIVFVEHGFETRTYHRSVLEGPENYDEIESASGPLTYKWDGVVFERKPIKSLTFKVNGQLDVTYRFVEDTGSGNMNFPSDPHACMARDLIELGDSRNWVVETNLLGIKMIYEDATKYGNIVFAGKGGFLQLVSTEFCEEIKTGVHWALSDLGIFGHCRHGLLRATIPIELIRHDSSVVTVADARFKSPLNTLNSGACFESRHPDDRQETFRTGIDREDDTRERRQWLGYGLFSGSMNGSLSGYAQTYYTDGAAWVYFDTEGNSCDVECYTDAYNEEKNIYELGGYARMRVILPFGMTYDGDPHPNANTYITLPDVQCLNFQGWAKPMLMARTKDGRRAIFAACRQLKPPAGYWETRPRWSSYFAWDFFELTVSGVIDRAAEHAGLSFTWERIDVETQNLGYDTTKQNKTTGIVIDYTAGYPSYPIVAADCDNIKTWVSTNLQRAVVGCYFEGEDLRWIEVEMETQYTSVTTASFTQRINPAPGVSTQVVTGVGSFSLLFNGVVVDSVAYSSHYTKVSTTYLMTNETIGPEDSTDSSSRKIEGASTVGLRFQDRFLDDYTSSPGYGGRKEVWPIMYGPNVWGLGVIDHDATLGYSLELRGIYSPSEADTQIRTATAIGDSGYNEIGGYSMLPSDNSIYTSWNPVTSRLHVDSVPCRWI